MNKRLITRHISAITILLLSIGVMSACGGGGGGSDNNTSNTPNPSIPTPPAPSPPISNPQGSATNGELIFQTKLPSGNQFSCSNCHSISEDNAGKSTIDQLHRPAHPLFNAVNRTSFQNQTVSTLFDAANICVEDWLDASSFSESEQTWLDLNAYLTQQSNTATSTNITATQIDPIVDFSNGDKDQGQTIFNSTCATCHGENALGSSIAPNLTQRQLTPERVAQKVRTSGPSSSQVFVNLTGGNMPLWTQERLSNSDLQHISKYVESFSENSSTAMTCEGTDHPKVGKKATLSTFAHGVRGTAEITNNCTIIVSNFFFDGNAPNVEFYGGQNGNYLPPSGFSISNRIDGTVFNNETVTIKLNNPSVLDRLDGISVWCVEFDADFGNGLFL